MQHEDMKNDYKKGSISLGGAVAMGTGVMIGAGIFALTGQIAELAVSMFPLALVLGAIITGVHSHGRAFGTRRDRPVWPIRGLSAVSPPLSHAPH